jgi:hypothetical protein
MIQGMITGAMMMPLKKPVLQKQVITTCSDR